MMVYVQLDDQGNIKGVYGNPQPQPDGSCLTEKDAVPDDSPAVAAYMLASKTQPKRISDGDLAALLIEKGLLSAADVASALSAVSVISK